MHVPVCPCNACLTSQHWRRSVGYQRPGRTAILPPLKRLGSAIARGYPISGGFRGGAKGAMAPPQDAKSRPLP